MKTDRSLIKLPFCLCLLAALIAAGCFPEKRIIWAPDGQTAAVVTSDTLYFCDAQGNLSEPQATNVVALVWLQNSKDGVAEIKHTANSWADFASTAGDNLAKEVSAEALRLLPKFKANTKMEAVLQDTIAERGEEFAHAVQLYWRDRCPDQLMDLAPVDEAELQAERAVEFASLRQFHYEAGKMTLGTVIHRSLEYAIELRLSPSGTWLAYVSATGLHALPVDGSQPATTVDNSSVAAFFDWSPDGRSLVFIKSPRGKNRQEVNLGALARKRLLNAEGQLEMADDCEDLAGVLFDEASKVRCLKDGRILFSSMPLQLPATGMEMPQREQLFALDPTRYHSAIRLIPNAAETQMPKRIFPFEVSPDEKCLSLLLDQGGVAIFHLDSASVEMVQPDRDDSKIQILPTWKSNDELSYVSIATPNATNQERHLEIALWQKGQSRLLSAQWPSNVMVKIWEDDNAKASK
jgi:hypothetical protein